MFENIVHLCNLYITCCILITAKIKGGIESSGVISDSAGQFNTISIRVL
jgi:hypothetical protein